MNRTHMPRIVFAVLLVGLLAGCSLTNSDAATTAGPATSEGRPLPSATELEPTDSEGGVVPTATGPVDAEQPLPTGVFKPEMNALGPLFETGDDPLPAQTLAALANAGGEALPVNGALTAFGVYDIPRPSGLNSVVMEMRSTGVLLTGGTSSLTAEVVYMVASDAPIEELLATAAGVPAETATVDSVDDYDGTTGDPRCARLDLDVGPVTTGSVQGCEYRGDPLRTVRSVGFSRVNLPVAHRLVLPPAFVDFPDELFDAGTVEAFTATFGRPSGPSGNTIQLEVRVVLDHEPALGDNWQTDGPGRWWNDTATVTIDGGQAVWRMSTRADQP